METNLFSIVGDRTVQNDDAWHESKQKDSVGRNKKVECTVILIEVILEMVQHHFIQEVIYMSFTLIITTGFKGWNIVTSLT